MCVESLIICDQAKLDQYTFIRDFPAGSDGKELPTMQEIQVPSLGWQDPLEKGMATHSSILA